MKRWGSRRGLSRGNTVFPELYSVAIAPAWLIYVSGMAILASACSISLSIEISPVGPHVVGYSGEKTLQTNLREITSLTGAESCMSLSCLGQTLLHGLL